MTYPADKPMREGDRTAAEQGAMGRVERVVRRARINLLWEAVWPIVAPFVVLGALYVALSWLGLWRITSTPVRYVILAAFGVAALYFLWRSRRSFCRSARRPSPASSRRLAPRTVRRRRSPTGCRSSRPTRRPRRCGSRTASACSPR